MLALRTVLCCLLAGVVMGAPVPTAGKQYPTPDPKVMSYKLPNQLHWTVNRDGAGVAVLYGNPGKTGLYVILVKWEPHHMSHPHWHPHDRYITVLSGTWWVGWGRQFNTKRMFPMPAGSYVVDYGQQVHYDGARNSEVILEIVGQGPGTAIPVKAKM